jgi:hypothetical protein
MFLAALLTAVSYCMGPGEKAMNDDQNTSPPGEHEVAGVPIRPAVRPAIPGKAQPTPGGECVRPFVNDQLNSRVSERLRAGEWRVSWQSAIDPGFPPAYVLQAADRIVVQGTGRWQLFDLNGHSVNLANFGPSDIVLDPVSKLIYMADRFGVLEAHRFSDGAAVFALPFSGGIEWQRAFYARRGRDFAVVSYERRIQPHSTSVPNAVTLEAQDLGDPLKIDHEAIASATRTGDYFFAAPQAWGASAGAELVVAMRNEILVTDFGRKISVRMTDSFDAGCISLDDTARIYALAANHGRFSLWSLTPRGERVFAQDFPQDALIPTPPINNSPPVIGYDHRIYVTAGQLVLCVSPEGRVLWRGPTGGAIAGMIITPDDQLIVSAGSSLVAFDTHGTRRALSDFRGDTLRTPPAMVKGGDLLVASLNKLYRLSAR